MVHDFHTLRLPSFQHLGDPRTVTWTLLASTAAAGDTTLYVQDSVNWNVGDRIIIASTGDHLSQAQNEEAEILSITDDGTTINLSTYVALLIARIYLYAEICHMACHMSYVTWHVIYHMSYGMSYVIMAVLVTYLMLL